MSAVANPLTAKIADFLNQIGIEVIPAPIDETTFLPGIEVNQGRLLVDESRLKYPGDLLHEAGHLALAPAAMRGELSGEVNLPEENMDVIEVQAIAWSYAALVYLKLEPEVVFHEEGYKGKSEALLLNFRSGFYLGATGLEAAGMTAMGQAAEDLGVPPYPHMLKWLRS